MTRPRVAAACLLGAGMAFSVAAQAPQVPPRQPATAPLVATGLVVGRVVDAASGRGVPGAFVELTGGPARATPPSQPTPPGAVIPPPAPPPPASPLQVLTDAEGRFAFRGVTRGTYSLSASKAGYAAGGYGRFRPNGPTRTLQLDDGEKVGGITVRIFKYGVITGIVTDEAGEPVVGASVRAYRRGLVAGRRVFLLSESTAQTDDRGVYRLASLIPGEYVVAVPMVPVTVPSGRVDVNPQTTALTSQALTGVSMPSPAGGGHVLSADSRFLLQPAAGTSGDVRLLPDASGRLMRLATIYYPGARTLAEAQVIGLASGDERSGVDFALARVPAVSIAGHVIGPDGPAASHVVRLLPAPLSGWAAEPETAVALTNGEGEFVFAAVPAGQYVIQVVRAAAPAVAMAPALQVEAGLAVAGGSLQAQSTLPRVITTPADSPALWAMTPVTVGDGDIDGVSLVLRAGPSVSGRLEFTGSRPRPDMQRMSQIPILLEPADGPQLRMQAPPAAVRNDGRFDTVGHLPGRYFLRVGAPPAGWMVDTITAGGVDVTERPIPLEDTDLTDVVITFTDLIPDVRGTVSGAPPDVDAPPAIVMFPADSAMWKSFGLNPTRLRMTRVGPGGVFTLGALPPGEYVAAAIPDEFSGEWQDPDYLEVLARVGARFTLGRGERRAIDVPFTPIGPPGAGIGRMAPVAAPAWPLPAEPGTGPFAPDDRAQQVRDTRPPPVPGASTGAITGRVTIDDGSLRPARYARVTARGGSLAGDRSTLTDDDGRYAIEGLPPGSYQVLVSAPSYLTVYYGARRPVTGPGTPVTVAAGHVSGDIDVALPRGGVVTGTVFGPDGEPAPNARVQLLQRVMSDGEPTLASTPASGAPVTDDRGMFRLYGLRPGSYVLLVTPVLPSGLTADVRQLSEMEIRAAFAEAGDARPAGASAVLRPLAPAPPGPRPVVEIAGAPVSMAPVFYPGTPDELDAMPIAVVAGQEAYVSVALRLVPTARIEGTVLLPDGRLAPQIGTSVSLNRVTSFSTSATTVRMVEDGRFQVAGVAPGRYTVIVRHNAPAQRVDAPPGSQAAPATVLLWGQQDVTVDGTDLMGLQVVLGQTQTVTGRVVFEGDRPPPGSEVQVRLDPAGRGLAGSFARIVRPDEATTFAITGVTPGRYRLTAQLQAPAPPSGMTAATALASARWSVRAATIGGRDVHETPLEVHAGGSGLDAALVTLSSRLPQLAVTVEDRDGHRLAGVTIVLFTADRGLWVGSGSRRLRTSAQPDPGGQYRFAALLPGDYYVAVVTEVEPRELSNPEFLEQLIPASVRVTLADGDRKLERLRLAGGLF